MTHTCKEHIILIACAEPNISIFVLSDICDCLKIYRYIFSNTSLPAQLKRHPPPEDDIFWYLISCLLLNALKIAGVIISYTEQNLWKLLFIDFTYE